MKRLEVDRVLVGALGYEQKAVELNSLETTRGVRGNAETELFGVDDLDIEGVCIAVRAISDGRDLGNDVRFISEGDPVFTLYGFVFWETLG
ncbi:MAG: hypothetical protein ACK5O2_07900 [Microthrixaceae bacterium]